MHWAFFPQCAPWGTGLGFVQQRCTKPAMAFVEAVQFLAPANALQLSTFYVVARRSFQVGRDDFGVPLSPFLL